MNELEITTSYFLRFLPVLQFISDMFKFITILNVDMGFIVKMISAIGYFYL